MEIHQGIAVLPEPMHIHQPNRPPAVVYVCFASRMVIFRPNWEILQRKFPITFLTMADEKTSAPVKEAVCDVCAKGALTDHSVPEQGLSCIRCGVAMCDDCYHLSIRLYGFIGDKNVILGKPAEVSTTFNDWPYDEYFPEDFGGYQLSKGCIDCMTRSPPKRDKFGHFMRDDDYPVGESRLTREIAVKKRKYVSTK